MPLMSGGYNFQGELPNVLQQRVDQTLKLIDQAVAQLAQQKQLEKSHIRLLRPCDVCVIVDAADVYVVAAKSNTVAMPWHFHFYQPGKPMDLQTAMQVAENDCHFEQPFGFAFSLRLFDVADSDLLNATVNIAETYISEEIARIEKLNRLVRLNPIFQGRDFMLDLGLVFVLAPFENPFNTIFVDHIKPTVESIAGLRCIRADDIYDNKSIIEDIWRNINEASILVSELTGRNPNVFYETGVAHTIGKEVILITQHMSDVPFDLRHLRCIVYEYTPRGIQTLESNLRNTIDNIRSRIPK